MFVALILRIQTVRTLWTINYVTMKDSLLREFFILAEISKKGAKSQP